MKKDAKNLDFEKAQKKYELIKSIKNMQENQIVIDSFKNDYDIVNYIEKYKKIYI
jgi:excinuclease UvrABC nuclease subunit